MSYSNPGRRPGGSIGGSKMDTMSRKLRWGVLSTAAIGLKKVIPAMQLGQYTRVTAIASRDLVKARAAADRLGIETAYGSYEALIADPDVDAIYNPLPNQMHVPWTIKAAEAGKHVLCEKPLSMTLEEAKTLLAVQERTGVKIGEAFMIRSYTQWRRLRELLDQGRIGELRSVIAAFSYFNRDPKNIRNEVESGGGALYDIGCYCIHASRYAFGATPEAGGGADRARSRVRNRPADLGHSGFSGRARHFYLQHATGAVPAGAFSGDEGTDRDRDSVQRAPGPADADVHRPDGRHFRRRNRDRRV